MKSLEPQENFEMWYRNFVIKKGFFLITLIEIKGDVKVLVPIITRMFDIR